MPRLPPDPATWMNDGPPTVARPAATVILLRDGRARRLELLLVERNPNASFMGGAWVFPGGSVDPADGEGQTGLRTAARRELAEEAGIVLPAEAPLLVYARWITPEISKVRFDTWFYLASAPAGAQPRVDGGEIVDARWLSPEDALDQHADGKLFMVLPTIKQLQQLSGFASADALLDHARGRKVQPVTPRVVGSAEAMRIVLPGDPGFS